MRYLLSLSFLTLFLGVSGQSATEEALQEGQMYEFTVTRMLGRTGQKYVDTAKMRVPYDVSSDHKVIINDLSDDSVYYKYLNFNDPELYNIYNTPST